MSENCKETTCEACKSWEKATGFSSVDELKKEMLYFTVKEWMESKTQHISDLIHKKVKAEMELTMVRWNIERLYKTFVEETEE